MYHRSPHHRSLDPFHRPFFRLTNSGLEDDTATPMPGHLTQAASDHRFRHLPREVDMRAKDRDLQNVRDLALEASKQDRKSTVDNADPEDATTVYTSLFAGLFQRVICDEGHKLKNCRTKNSIAIDKLYCPNRWIVTATPMINRVTDMLGYLYLLWNPAWSKDLDSLDGWDHPGNNESLYSFDTKKEFLELCPNYCEKYHNLPLFVLDPRAFATMINSGKMENTSTASRVLRAVISILQLRWTMASEIALDDQAKYQPGVDVPIYHISGVELRQSKYEAAEYKKIWRIFSPYLTKGGANAKPSKKPGIEATGLRDMAVHRHIALATFDLRLNTLMVRKGQHSAAQAKAWSDTTNDHGFTDYFLLTRPIPSMPNYLDRLSVCAYLVGESVKLRYACTHIQNALYGDESGRFKGKVVFFVNWPHTQWGLDALLFNLGLPYYSIWPETTAADKADILAKWNDPDDDAQFLILNSRSSALGLNIQGACSKVVILDMPDNIPTLIQIIGRLHRIGQLFVQYVWVCCVLGTYDQWIFANATAKMMAQIAGEAHFEKVKLSQAEREQMITAAQTLSDDEAHALLKSFKNSGLMAQAEEYIRQQLGQRSSRLSWRTSDLEEPHRRSASTPSRRHRADRISYSSPSGESPSTGRTGTYSPRLILGMDPVHSSPLDPFHLPPTLTNIRPGTAASTLDALGSEQASPSRRPSRRPSHPQSRPPCKSCSFSPP